ncbi:hypothetical protein AGMMS50229_01470 [Campylobacterota bacterium]|nr:hypothetical protein AGMMS50229_01470 [Campylobacterota bacterium]
MRRGVALLITMVFVIALFGFATIFMARTNSAFKREESRMTAIGANAALFDLSNEVVGSLSRSLKTTAESACTLTDDKNDCQEKFMSVALDMFYRLPLALELGDAGVLLNCKSAQRQIDINTLKLPPQPQQNDPALLRRETIQRYLQDNYRLYSSWQLFELFDFVFDTSGVALTHIKNDKRLNVSSDRFEHGRIGSLRALKLIAEDYELLTHDDGVRDVIWEEIFAFDSHRAQIAFRYMDETTCKLIFSTNANSCDYLGVETTTSEQNSIINYSKEAIAAFSVSFTHNPILSCQVNYSGGRSETKMSFIYDVDKQESAFFTIAD